MPRPLRGPLLALVLVGLGAAGLRAQQACTDLAGPTAGASVAYVRLPLATGDYADGTAVGLTGALRSGSVAVGAEAEYTHLQESTVRPITGRVAATTTLARIAGLDVCGTLLGGVARIDRSDDTATNLAGGLAALVARRMSLGSIVLTPYAGVRGLAGRTSGTILGEDVQPTGYSLGGEGGLVLTGRRAAAILRVTADGFDPALGATPYPALAIRLAAGLRF